GGPSGPDPFLAGIDPLLLEQARSPEILPPGPGQPGADGAAGSDLDKLVGWAWEDFAIPKLAGELPGAVYAGSDITPAIRHLLNTEFAWVALVNPNLDDPA